MLHRKKNRHVKEQTVVVSTLTDFLIALVVVDKVIEMLHQTGAA